MILRCENCQTMYMFTEAQLKGQGYKFTCKKCGRENTVALPSDTDLKEQNKPPAESEQEVSEIADNIFQSELETEEPEAKESSEETVVPPEQGKEEIADDIFQSELKTEEPETKESPKEAVVPPEQEPELEDIFASLDTPESAEPEPIVPDEKEAREKAVSAEETELVTGSEFAPAPEEEPSHKDEEVIEGFSEFTMEDLQRNEQKEVPGTEKSEQASQPEQEDTSWLESTKIEEHPQEQEKTDTGAFPEKEMPVEEETIPEDLDTAAVSTESISETAADKESSLLKDEAFALPETAPRVEQAEETEEAAPVVKPRLTNKIVVAGVGIAIVLAVLMGGYYYLVEYAPVKPDFSKLTYMTYSILPVSGKTKERALKLYKNADALYWKDTMKDYRKSLRLYEQAVSIDHHLTDAYIGIAKDIAILKSKNNQAEPLEGAARFLTRLKTLLNDSANYKLIRGMLALAKNNNTRAADEIAAALKESPHLAEALYYKGYIDFIQDKSLIDTASVISQAIKFNPLMVKARILLAKIYQKQRKIPEAIDILNRILKLYPYNVSAAVLEAELKAGTISGTTQSISKLNNILHESKNEIVPYDKAMVYYTIGALELIRKDYNPAIKMFKSSLLYNRAVKTYIALGDAYLKKGDLNNAEGQYRLGISLGGNLPEAYFRLAHAYYLDHKYVLSVMNYTNGLKLRKNNTQALYGLALAREKNGEFSIALNIIKKAVKLSPNAPEFIALNGRLLRKKGDYKGAISILSKAVRKFPDYAPLHTEYGAVLGREGDFKNAIQQLKTAMSLSPDTPDNYAYLADVLNKTSQHAKAEKYALEAISNSRNFAYAYEVLGDIYLNEHKLNDAIKSYKTAASLQPYQTDILYKSATAYMMGGSFTSAVSLLKRAIKINPLNAAYHYTLGKVYQNTGNIELAINEYTKAIDINSKMAEAYYARGIINIAAMNDLAAINDLQNAIKYAPNNATYILTLADYYYNNKETYVAIDYLKKLLKIAPENPEAHYRMGVAYNYIGKTKKAKKQFTEALKLSPNYPKAMVGLGGIYYQNGDTHKAQMYYKKAIKLSPKNGDAYYRLGIVYEYNGMYERAFKAYSNAAKYNKKPAAAYLKVGIMLSDLNKPEQAKAAILKALKLGLSGNMDRLARNKLRNLM